MKLARLKWLLILVAATYCWSTQAETPLQIASSTTTRNYFPELESIAEEAFGLIGYSVEFIVYPGERSIHLLRSNLIDGDVQRLESFSSIVSNAIKVDVPVISLDLVAVVQEYSIYETHEDLIGKRVGITRGIKTQELIADKLKAKRVVVESLDSALKMIATDRLEFTILTRDIAQQFIDEGYSLRILEKPLQTLRYYIWLAEKNAHLVEQLETALAQVMTDRAKQ